MTMNYETKYKQALAEIEEEMIRKDIISYLRNEKIVKRYISDIEIDKWIAWLEKQGGHKGTDNGETEFHVGDLVVINETTYQITEISNSHVVLSFNGRECKFGLDVLNNAQKFEPQFKVGDWVILNGIVVKILDKQKYGFVGLDIDGKDFFCNYGHTDSMRLWTINDAKEGDVLMSTKTRNCPFIYRKTDYNNNLAYYYAGVNANGDFCEGCLKKTMYHFGSVADITPATKEQRDLLFKKMKEAGYEWNAEKKELKKMEVASKEGDDERIRKAIHIYLDWLDGRKDYQPKGVYTIRDMIDWVIKQDKKISADKVIEWLNHRELSRDDVVTSVIPDDSPTSVPHRVKWLSDEFIKQFKKDFGL